MTAKKNVIKIGGADVTVDPDAMYRVALSAPVRAGGMVYRPSDRNSQMRGDLLMQAAKESAGAIVSVELIEVNEAPANG